MRLLKHFADNSSPESYAVRLRRKRFALFAGLLAAVPRPMRILDVGGTERFWRMMNFGSEDGVEITLLNVQASELELNPAAPGLTHFVSRVGDARSMPEFVDRQFDVVFSNSVLEHVGEFADQRRMISEVRRVAKRYFIQTPNYYFPLEPHFLVPGFQYLPVAFRVWLLRTFRLGWAGRVADKEEAEAVVRGVRLLSARELRRLCPEAQLYREKVFGLTKSFVLYCGF